MARKSRKQLDTAPDICYDVDRASRVYDVGAYVRLSSVDRKKKGDSIETQQAIISAFIDQHPGLVLRETYIDNGTTGMTFERDAFKRMLEDAENGKINCIVTKDLSRLGRNALDTGYYIETYFPAHGLRFIAINDEYDSADGQSGGMIVSLKNIINENYALEIGRKIRATKQMNIREGAFVGRFPPYGYLKSDKDNHKLVIDADAAPVIRMIYGMAAEGSSVSVIIKHLNDAEVLTPRRYFHQKGLASEKEVGRQVHWSKGVAYAILHNRVYCGDMVQGKHTNIDHIQTKRPQSEWVITENTHEPIVSRELWERVQARWEATRHEKRVPYSENIFKGRIFCGHCGYAMRRVRHGKSSYGFTCETRIIYGEDDCVQVSINENDLRVKLLVELETQIEDFAVVPAQSAVQSVEPELQSIRRELDRCNGFLKSLYESLAVGDITSDEYREMKQDYEAKITALSERERQLREIAAAQAIQDKERQKATDNMKAIHSIDDLTSDVIAAFIERIDVFEDKSIKVKGRLNVRNDVETEVGCHE